MLNFDYLKDFTESLLFRVRHLVCLHVSHLKLSNNKNFLGKSKTDCDIMLFLCFCVTLGVFHVAYVSYAIMSIFPHN